MRTNEMKDKTCWLTIDQNQTSCIAYYYRFSLPSFLLEDPTKVSKRVLTLVHRCTEGVFAEFKGVAGAEVQLGNQLSGTEAETFDKGNPQETPESE
jgi:hypothetical protein